MMSSPPMGASVASPEPALEINECFARDGLQHERAFLPAELKVKLLNGFADAGFRRIEATSYSSPRWVPAFADASEVLRLLRRRPGVAYKATCPNLHAVQRALVDADAGFGAEELSLLTSASESHSHKNLRAGREAQWERVEQMAAAAQGRFRLVGVVSVAFGCPFEGRIDPAVVSADAQRFRDLGASFITIGDTTGLADPRAVNRLFSRLYRDHPGFPFVAHFHDTRGVGLANAVAAVEAGCTRIDTAMGGVGGHPENITYGAGDTGNIATEDTVFMFEAMGLSTGLDLDAVMRLSQRCEHALERPLRSKVARAGQNPILTGAGV